MDNETYPPEGACSGYMEEIETYLADLESEDEDKREAAIDRLVEIPLSVSVRDGWRGLSDAVAEDGPEEFEILLGTGGPAARIYGTYGKHGSISHAELQYQDWFQPWVRVPVDNREALMKFADFIAGGIF